jgi:BlaI family transcriptional regulator, penicillinase repressor
VQTAVKRKLAYTTIQTVLNILERKGKVQRVKRGRAYIYNALVSQEQVRVSAVEELVEEMFGGAYESLLTLLSGKSGLGP